MENISVLESSVGNTELVSFKNSDELFASEVSRPNPVLENILSEGGNDFFRYLTWAGLVKEPNLMVLSSMHHYYYDHNDLIGIKTLINLKRLNQIKHLESFLHTLNRILPSRSYFIGCFRNNLSDRGKEVGYHSSKFFNGIINILDSRLERNLSRGRVTRLMEGYGFKVIDITEINGMSYFWAQNLRKPGM